MPDSLSRSFPESAEAILKAHGIWQYHRADGVRFKNGNHGVGLDINQKGFAFAGMKQVPGVVLVALSSSGDWLDDLDFAKFKAALDKALKFLEGGE